MSRPGPCPGCVNGCPFYEPCSKSLLDGVIGLDPDNDLPCRVGCAPDGATHTTACPNRDEIPGGLL